MNVHNSLHDGDEAGGALRSWPIVIIGAGAGGICLGIRLKRAGIHFVILEKAEGLGGVWRENTYPGCACDTHIHQYAYSFAPNPGWSHVFAEQPEILAYLERCACDHGIDAHILYGKEVVRAEFDEAIAGWRVRTQSDEELLARIVVTAVGQLSRPATPEISGSEDFFGTQFHSARWDHGHDLRAERVAVVGNGASAVQFIPRIAPIVKELLVFQRSPNWIVPKGDRAYWPVEKWGFRNLPLLGRLYRYLIYWQWEKYWPKFKQNSRAANRWPEQVGQLMREQICRSDLVPRLIPDYPVGCKRVLLSDDYLSALQLPNVKLITVPIDHMTRVGIVTADGRNREVDSIIYATGFKANEFLTPMQIIGAGEQSLHDCWREGAEAHLGLAVSGFPNFFMIYGPNTNLGHNSIIFMIECQVEYILQCANRILASDTMMIDVKAEEMRCFNKRLQQELAETAWAGGCRSWYKTERGKVVNNWSRNTFSYWWRTRRPDFSQYNLMERGCASVRPAVSQGQAGCERPVIE